MRVGTSKNIKAAHNTRGRHVGRHIGRQVGKLKNRSKIDAKMHCILGFIFRTLPDAILNVAIYYAILNVTQMRF